MRLRHRNTDFLWLSSLVCTLMLGQSVMAAAPAAVMAASEKVAGLSQADYAARWWQWANRVLDGVRPYQDPSGGQCALNQSGEVWFLAGTDGTSEIIRHCTVPAGKYLFFPIISMLGNSEPAKLLTCEQAKAAAAGNNDHLTDVRVKIDGASVNGIARYRVHSEQCFDAYPTAPYMKSPQYYFPAATDGYWLMLKPLSPGLHNIKVNARYDNPGSKLGDLEQVFEYQLSVEVKKEDVPIPPKLHINDGIIVQTDSNRSPTRLSMFALSNRQER